MFGKFLKKKPYVNLESTHLRDLAFADPITFLEQYPEGAILDEIQRAPQLLSYIQVKIDEKKTKGNVHLNRKSSNAAA